MTLLKKPSFYDDHSSPTFKLETKDTLAPPEANRSGLHPFTASATLVLSTTAGTHVLAKTAQADSKPPAIDPVAMSALNKMGTYLRGLKAFQVTSDITADDVLDDGEIITDSRKVNLLAQKPNMLRVEIQDDEKHAFLFFDGKNFTVYGKLVNFYATAPMTGTIGEFVDKVNDKYGVEIPLVDLFKWGTDEDAVKKITSAIDLGPATVNEITCEQYAFRQEGADWQIWIQLGEYPLPRKLIIRTLSDEARPQYTSVLTWNLAPSYDEGAFTFDPPPGASRIKLEELNTAK